MPRARKSRTAASRPRRRRSARRPPRRAGCGARERAASSSRPLPSRAETSTTARPSASTCSPSARPGRELARGALGGGAEVGLVHHDDVGQLERARLHELEQVAGAGLRHADQRVREVGHVGLALADADRLDEHHVEGRGQHDTPARAPRRDRRADRARPASAGTRRGRPRSKRTRTRSPSSAPPLRGLDGSTARMPTVSPRARARARSASSSVDLPAPGGPGEADARRPREGSALARARRAARAPRRALGPRVVDQVERPGDRGALAREQALARAARSAAAACASATTSTISPMMRVRSKSLGV